jgi:hypothetical protein
MVPSSTGVSTSTVTSTPGFTPPANTPKLPAFNGATIIPQKPLTFTGTTITPPSQTFPPAPPPAVTPPTFTPPAPVVPASPWLFPDSSQRVLTAAELKALNPNQLWQARNEIYARKGYIFSSDRGRRFAQTLGSFYSGYTSNADRIEASFNEYEKKNVDNIKAYEQRR